MAIGKGDTSTDAVAVGRAVYEKLRERLEATDNGSFVVIDALSGDYEVDASPAVARRRLLARQPEPNMYEKRIGRPASYKLVNIRQTGPDD